MEILLRRQLKGIPAIVPFQYSYSPVNPMRRDTTTSENTRKGVKSFLRRFGASRMMKLIPKVNDSYKLNKKGRI